MAIGAIIGGALAAVGSIAGAGISARASSRNTSSANRYNWHMQQQMLRYNTRATDPVYIRQRQEAAGYNAALLASPNSLGQAAYAPNPAPAQIPDTSALGSIGTGIANAVNVAIDSSRASAQNSLDNAKQQQIYIENQYRATEAIARINNVLEDTHSKRTRRQLDEIMKRFQERLLQNNLQMSSAQIEQIKEQTKGQVMENVMSSVRMRAFPEIMRLDIANSAANLAVQKQVERLTTKQVESEAQKIAESIARTGFYNEQAYTQGRQTQLLGEQYEAAKRSNRVGDATEREQIELIKTELIRAVNNSGANNQWQLLNFMNRPFRSSNGAVLNH